VVLISRSMWVTHVPMLNRLKLRNHKATLEPCSDDSLPPDSSCWHSACSTSCDAGTVCRWQVICMCYAATPAALRNVLDLWITWCQRLGLRENMAKQQFYHSDTGVHLPGGKEQKSLGIWKETCDESWHQSLEVFTGQSQQKDWTGAIHCSGYYQLRMAVSKS
jgi:hypothetical protein